MNLPSVMLVAAATTRSQAYAQAMAKAGLTIGTLLLFEPKGETRFGQSSNPPSPRPLPEGIFCPDPAIAMAETCRKIAETTLCIEAGHINDPVIATTLSSLEPRPSLIVYSGFGGQLVSRELLEANPPFLHIHSGWLPDYRGSTTLHYHLLSGQRCGVSAILLAPELDQGPIVGQHWYPPPPSGDMVDHLYDPAIRADLLVRVLTHWGRTGSFPLSLTQTREQGMDYYIIHPVLKHLALLSLGQRGE